MLRSCATSRGPRSALVADPNATFDFWGRGFASPERSPRWNYVWLEEPIDPRDAPGLKKINDLGLLRMAAGGKRVLAGGGDYLGGIRGGRHPAA